MRAGETVAGLEGHATLTESGARRDRAHRRDGRRASLHRAAATGRRRHHRRAQQRQLRVRRARDPSRLPGKPGVLPRQGARMRVVLRGALRRQGDRAGRSERRRGRGDRDAPGAALHRRLGRGTRDVRARQSVLRARRRRHARHVGVPLRADRREDHADHRREVRPGDRVSREARRRREGRRALRRNGRHPRSRTRSPMSTR